MSIEPRLSEAEHAVPNFVVYCIQTSFEVNPTIVGVKIRHDFKWSYHNPLQTCTSL
jgi:hypothetical protein